ncbi:MAG: peptide-methionine (R)-S-oxide reductase MsrB [Bacteroidota bacterium]
MNRRRFLRNTPLLLAAPSVLGALGCNRSSATLRSEGIRSDDDLRVHPDIGSFDILDKPDAAWEGLVSNDAYYILFEEGTERPFSSPLNDNKARGTYVCASCYLPLFPSTTKYDSRTGWPSFWAPLDGRLGEKVDTKFGMIRTEYHCIRCGGHQGHVFNDGPQPTGLRYCNNGLALRFVPEDEPLPALRG